VRELFKLVFAKVIIKRKRAHFYGPQSMVSLYSLFEVTDENRLLGNHAAKRIVYPIISTE